MIQGGGPSFSTCLDLQNRLLHRDSTFAREIWRLDDKLTAYEHADRLGVAHPEVYRVWKSFEEITFDDLPRRVCIKPSTLFSGKGVFTLRILSGSRALHATSGAPVSLHDVHRYFQANDPQQEWRKLSTCRRDPPRYYAEALIGGDRGPLAQDLKLYMFRGRLGLVLLMRREREVERKYYDGKLNALGPIIYPHLKGGGMELPPDIENVVEAACKLSREVQLPFVRIDFLSSGSKPSLFGEITPTPGGSILPPPALDRALGLLWEEALEELLAEILNNERR
ncbi:MAG: hypothetical protein JJU45_05520 [Acidimicrobiia bacterium]|nr:hypothetical protein [Acidimicrobiia bacterium]